MRKPLVYLDTQDYSNIADALVGRGHTHLLPVYEELRRIADEGYFQFCFSQVIVSEALQVAPKSLEIAKRKAEVMERLGGACAFPNPFWLLKNELNEVVFARRGAPVVSRCDVAQVVANGRWLEQELLESGQQPFDLFSGIHWSWRWLARFMLRKLPEERLQSFMSQLSMYQFLAAANLEGTFLDAARQRIGSTEVMQRMATALAYPTKLMFQPESAGTIVNLNTAVSHFGGKMMEMLEGFRRQTDEIQRNAGAPMPREFIESQMPSFASGMWTNTSRRQLQTEWKEEREYLKSDQFSQDISNLGFTKFFADLMTEVFVDVASNSHVRRRIKRSDGGDILHSLYIPHCRVLRADGGFASLVRNIGLKYGCTVVGDLTALPSVLRSIQALGSEGRFRNS